MRALQVRLGDLPHERRAVASCRASPCCPEPGPHHGSGIIMAPRSTTWTAPTSTRAPTAWSRAADRRDADPEHARRQPGAEGRARREPVLPALRLPDGRLGRRARTRRSERIFDVVESHAPGFRRSVIAHSALSPADLEREFGLVGGDIFHGAALARPALVGAAGAGLCRLPHAAARACTCAARARIPAAASPARRATTARAKCCATSESAFRDSEGAVSLSAAVLLVRLPAAADRLAGPGGRIGAHHRLRPLLGRLHGDPDAGRALEPRQRRGRTAAGPYYCAQGSLWTAYYNCMTPGAWTPLPPPEALKAKAERFAQDGRIDPTAQSGRGARLALLGRAGPHGGAAEVVEALRRASMPLFDAKHRRRQRQAAPATRWSPSDAGNACGAPSRRSSTTATTTPRARCCASARRRSSRRRPRRAAAWSLRPEAVRRRQRVRHQHGGRRLRLCPGGLRDRALSRARRVPRLPAGRRRHRRALRARGGLQPLGRHQSPDRALSAGDRALLLGLQPARLLGLVGLHWHEVRDQGRRRRSAR